MMKLTRPEIVKKEIGGNMAIMKQKKEDAETGLNLDHGPRQALAGLTAVPGKPLQAVKEAFSESTIAVAESMEFA